MWEAQRHRWMIHLGIPLEANRAPIAISADRKLAIHRQRIAFGASLFCQVPEGPRRAMASGWTQVPKNLPKE
jgi:hypothetical protein